MTLARLAALHGVATAYSPSAGVTVPVPDTTVVEVLAALDVDAATPEALRASLAATEAARDARLLPPTLVLWRDGPPEDAPRQGRPQEDAPRQGRPYELPRPLAALPPGTDVRITTEHGDEISGTPRWARLPLGVHRLQARARDGRTAHSTLVVAPARVPQPSGRGYGILVQLYSLLSTRSWGMGDLGDLRELADWAGRDLGAGFVQVNPLHAAVPGTPTDPSPYRPSSRRFPDPVHLRIEDVPEYAYVRGHLSAEERAELDALIGRAAELREGVLRKGELIDRDAVWVLKRQALELLWRVPLGPGRQAALRRFRAERGQALLDHATWCALVERYGADRRQWPEGLCDPRSAATARERDELADRVDFHCRLAWLTDEQLAATARAAREAGMAVGIVHDLAVGVHPDGADAWAQGDAFAAGMSVGAPPDAFNARGQDWGLPPWRPDALAASGYAPYRDLLRGLLRHAGALRIDHVMGLFRLWWVPEGREPTEGTYVRYDADAMLAILALEAHRAGAVVIGEDLGTVEPGVRESLQRRGVLGTSVLWFERDWEGTRRPLPPRTWRADCVATATTHDLPSTAARLTGEHVELRHRLGLLTRTLEEERAEDAEEVAEWLAYLRTLGLLEEGPRDEEAEIRAVYRFLRRTPARMAGVWLPDAVGDRRPQNLPGTWDQYPNWRLPIADAEGRPVTLEELAVSPRLHALMDVLRPAGPSMAPPDERGL
ncbi:4-alpha-glucanotransferase [Streptomyces sp. CB03234]|uniref:4-alpha-glucanotransferase n=1 Tax=Streptomyces sp. (strain CB03234) TaxID=1703937 RepID=UPI00093D7AFA|nr:4-alpha-glucanotransferase [Streptomyces sp. CB03234]OKK07819.1 4-alpha-glucanotransferase [Streptomyces sp. CB03234]